MKRLAFSLALTLLLAGCAGTGPIDPVGAPDYAAIGYDPFWTVAIGQDAIVLTRGPGPGEAGNAVRSVRYPRTLPRTVNGSRRWETEGAEGRIAIEASPGPCTSADDRRRYPDRVRVLAGATVLEGCGGREIRSGAGR